MRAVDDVNGGLNHSRVSMHAVKVRSNQLSVPGPVVFGIAGRMNASVSSTMLDVPLKSSLLACIQDRACCQQKNDRIIAREVGFGKDSCIFSKIYRHALTQCQHMQGRDSIRDRCMTKGPRF